MKRLSSMLLSSLLVFAALLGILLVAQPRVEAAPQAITPIGAARAVGVGWSGTIEGNVTVPPNVYGPYYFAIQDNTGGIYIYVQSGGPSVPTLALGDLVQVDGSISLYSGLLELSPVTAITNLGAGTPPDPQVTTTGNAGSTQGLLVQVSGTATWSTTPPAPGASDWSFNLDDGSGSVTIFVDKDTHIDMSSYTSPASVTVIGLSSNHSGVQIMPRFQADVQISDVIAPTVIGVVPTNNATNVSLYKPITATFSEPISVTTLNNATFTVINSAGSVAGTIGYDEATQTASFTPAAPLAVSTRYTATLGTGITDRAGNPLAAPYVWSFTTGSTIDTYPPFVSSKYPADNATNVPLNASLVITFNEELKPSTVIAANFTLVGPGGTIGWSTVRYEAAAKRVTLTPQVLLPNTSYTINISPNVTDWAGNPVNSATRSWSFGTAGELAMQAYFGDLHNHSSYSDGSQTPTDAFAHGKAAGFDFMAITDHSYAIDDSEWAATLNAVNAATIPGTFIAIRGAEYTQGAEGHLNVYNTVRHPCRTNTGAASCDYVPNLEAGVTVDGFYHWLSITGTQAVDSAGSLAQFNHPGWINFNDWTYHPEVSPTMRLEEVGNGSGTSYVFSEDEYIRSLDYGWKIGATNNADTHSPYWGTNTDHRTGVWMTSLTKTDLLDALRARRTFATEDKNYALSMKANGVWMGSDIPNTGSLAFEISGADPDGEGGVLAQLITFGGEVVTQTTTASSDFTWQPIVPVTPGEHYYYVKVTQPDGDRIVSSPIWAHGEVDVSLTDLTIEPTIASIYNPSLITARVTSRMATTQTVTVTFQIPGLSPQSLSTTVPACVKGPCIDGYSSIAWQPVLTGPVTITAMISGTPAGDNLEDNVRSTVMHVTDEHLPLVLIDAAHGNTNAAGREMRMFVKDLSDHRYNVLKNLAPLTAATLNTDTVKLLVITAPETAYTSDELDAIANYAATGGSLWICGLADYTGKVLWANTVTDRLNSILDRIETRTGSNINMRLNDDEVIDGNTNNGYVFGVEPGSFPGQAATSIGVNVKKISTWSLSSIRGRLVTQPITTGTPGVQIAVQGDMDPGYSSDFYHNPYHTSNTDADNQGDAYIYNPTWVYPATQPPGAIPLPLAAVTQLPDGGGRLMLYGDSNDGFGTFAYTAGDGKQNELFNLETVMWLLGDPVQKSTIAQARAYNVVNQPQNLRKLVWIEGKITAAFGEFFNVLYVQDETGGITIHAPAGDISATQYLRGAQVRVLGTIDIYQGDTEVEFFEAEQVQVITSTIDLPAPLPLSTHDAALEANQGWLTQITGTVVAKNGESIFVDDGSGPVRAFLDGYNGTWDDIHVLDQVTVKGLISEDGAGNRIRVRNHNMHPPEEIPDDVTIIATGLNFSGSTASVAPTAVNGGDLLTYTLTVSNSGDTTGPFILTDTLDAHVSLVSAPNMTATGSTLVANGSLNSQATQTFAFVVRANYGYSGTLHNTAHVGGDGFIYSLDTPAAHVTGAYKVYLPLVRK
jgi:uncharacterized repeat protein (TIGR01451 family)